MKTLFKRLPTEKQYFVLNLMIHYTRADRTRGPLSSNIYSRLTARKPMTATQVHKESLNASDPASKRGRLLSSRACVISSVTVYSCLNSMYQNGYVGYIPKSKKYVVTKNGLKAFALLTELALELKLDTTADFELSTMI